MLMHVPRRLACNQAAGRGAWPQAPPWAAQLLGVAGSSAHLLPRHRPCQLLALEPRQQVAQAHAGEAQQARQLSESLRHGVPVLRHQVVEGGGAPAANQQAPRGRRSRTPQAPGRRCTGSPPPAPRLPLGIMQLPQQVVLDLHRTNTGRAWSKAAAARHPPRPARALLGARGAPPLPGPAAPAPTDQGGPLLCTPLRAVLLLACRCRGASRGPPLLAPPHTAALHLGRAGGPSDRSSLPPRLPRPPEAPRPIFQPQHAIPSLAVRRGSPAGWVLAPAPSVAHGLPPPGGRAGLSVRSTHPATPGWTKGQQGQWRGAPGAGGALPGGC